MTGPQVHSHHTRHTSNDTNPLQRYQLRLWATMRVVGSNFKYNKGDVVLLEESPDSDVGCHLAPSSMHPFVCQRCRSVRTEEKTKLVLLSMKLQTCVTGPETLHFHGAPTWTPDQVSVQTATINSEILYRCLMTLYVYETKTTP